MASLKTIVTQGVANAFVQLGDLKQTIVFNTADSREYDFSTGDVAELSTSTSLEGVIEFIAVNESNGVNSILDGLKAKFIVNKADLPNGYSQYDSFTVDGTTYKILDFQDNGYSIEGTGVAG